MTARSSDLPEPKRKRGDTAFTVPTYRRIADDLRQKVGSGIIATGMMLPGRRDLAVEYGVSVPTIERAVSDLIADGTLRVDQRRGTFAGVVPESERLRLGGGRPAAPTRSEGITIGIVARLPYEVSEVEAAKEGAYTIIGGLERGLAATGGRSEFLNLWSATEERFFRAEDHDRLAAAGVDAVIAVYSLQHRDYPALMRAVERSKVPLIIVNEDKVSPPLLSVYHDHTDAAYQAANHLLAQGCERLTFFSARTASWVESRLEGVRRAVRDAGLPGDAVIDRVNRSSVESDGDVYDATHNGYAWAQETLERDSSLLFCDRCGVVAANDFMAFGFLRAASERGCEVSRDYVIVGFDDDYGARHHGLSSMRPPLEELGEEAVRMAIQWATDPLSARRVTLHADLIARSSSRFQPQPVRPR
ncbi:GntR family transcriptional regulator [bacterium]|nr:MAG: GntR family transcriptional regulator [bacterium]